MQNCTDVQGSLASALSSCREAQTQIWTSCGFWQSSSVSTFKTSCLPIHAIRHSASFSELVAMQWMKSHLPRFRDASGIRWICWNHGKLYSPGGRTSLLERGRVTEMPRLTLKPSENSFSVTTK